MHSKVRRFACYTHRDVQLSALSTKLMETHDFNQPNRIRKQDHRYHTDEC